MWKHNSTIMWKTEKMSVQLKAPNSEKVQNQRKKKFFNEGRINFNIGLLTPRQKIPKKLEI